MWRIWILVFFILFSIKGRAQQVTEQINQKDLDAVNNSNFLIRPFSSGYEGVQGTPFLYDNWAPGVVVMLNYDSLDQYQMKYDVFEDLLIVLSLKTNEPMVPMQQIIKYFSITDSIGKERIFYNTHPDDIDPEMNREGFFEALYDGNMKLLLKHKKQFVKASFEGAYNKGKPYDEFKDGTKRYYVLNSEGSFIELKKGKKGILKSLEDDGTLERIVKDKNLDLRKEEHIIELISVIDNM